MGLSALDDLQSIHLAETSQAPDARRKRVVTTPKSPTSTVRRLRQFAVPLLLELRFGSKTCYCPNDRPQLSYADIARLEGSIAIPGLEEVRQAPLPPLSRH